MLTDYVILGLCVVVLLSYFFDITFKYSKIPGVILLIALGIVLQIIVNYTGFEIPNLRPVLPVLGTLGLILIVMEASLEIKFAKNKLKGLLQIITASVVLTILSVSILTVAFIKIWNLPLAATLLNIIPLAVISSAVAISSSGLLNRGHREFITLESAFSDIFGILLFDFIILNYESFTVGLIDLTSKILVMIPIAIILAISLAWLLYRINYHVNYIIILTVVVMAYALAKLIYLPGLFFVVIFGLLLSNIHLFQNALIQKHIDFKTFVDFNKFRKDIDAFKKILAEFTFIVRSFFFIMFGFYVNLSGLIDMYSITLAAAITGFLFIMRLIFLYFFIGKNSLRLVWFAPRGLITILLFMSVPEMFRIEIINEEIVTLVILMSILVMMMGNMFPNKKTDAETQPSVSSEP